MTFFSLSTFWMFPSHLKFQDRCWKVPSKHFPNARAPLQLWSSATDLGESLPHRHLDWPAWRQGRYMGIFGGQFCTVNCWKIIELQIFLQGSPRCVWSWVQASRDRQRSFCKVSDIFNRWVVAIDKTTVMGKTPPNLIWRSEYHSRDPLIVNNIHSFPFIGCLVSWPCSTLERRIGRWTN